ncbi:hypothetical protein MC378_14975 [Polaribacter sp. MSW13]|uniref:Uncharacterized protein n=1 Tax=Polaribacter marinus TaxID=2916838 RepID=A0A9X1VQK2_9FLAO|nr:hypothetical protein [Polaribacter marinus]MCI2230481.1 hypothetical protein [Polaribacter marinus]
MKSKLTILLTLLILISCGRNKFEKKILGKWYDIRETGQLEFTQDSLNIWELTSTKAKWKANEKEIIYEFKDVFNDSIKNNSLKYKLHNDTLFIKTSKDSLFEFKFIKAENFTDFIFKKNNVIINLEDNSDLDFEGVENKYGLKIFVENKNGIIKIKSEYSENLENLENDLEKILFDLSPYFMNEYNDLHTERFTFKQWIRMNIYYSLFIDEGIPESRINSIVEKLRKTKIRKIYRVYKTVETEFVDFNNLKKIKL